jgi:predicted RND superfamily exporter protein
MKLISDTVIKHRKAVLILFILLAAAGMLFSTAVNVNYKISDYLPDGAQSTTAIRIMREEFGGELPNTRVYLSDITVNEALELKDRIAAVEGVLSVSWLDDVVGRGTLLTTPIEFLDQSVLRQYYKDGDALIQVTIENGAEKDTVLRIRALIKEAHPAESAVAGDAVNTAASQEMSVSESGNALIILLPVIILILRLTTESWIEPLLFLVSIGVAVFLNMGTNAFFEKTSYITQAISPVLQLAVSLDYAIFLLHSFREFRMENEPAAAMKLAMKKALSAIAASAATTVFGFLALLFMRFDIGPDLGLTLVKGILLSFISVMVFLPALTLTTHKWIDKTRHRRLIPDFKRSGRLLTKISMPCLILAALIAVPCFLAQSKVDFAYGIGGITEATRAGKDAALIERHFGRENSLVLLVPVGDTGLESQLCKALKDVPNVTGVVSYVTSVGSGIPSGYLESEITEQFYSGNFARIILYTDMDEESPEAFETVRLISDTAGAYYNEHYLAGQSPVLYDMKNIVTSDNKTVSLFAVIGIFLVILVTYRSLGIPLLLLFTIETAIWLNLSFVYFSNQTFNFIGYLVISTVQLGSTVDYAILLSDRYLGNRKTMTKKEAIRKAVGENITAILTSAVILAMAGFALYLTSTNRIISELGTLLGRGTLLSMLMVVCVLPALLVLFDRAIEKTTLKNGLLRRRQAGKSDRNP